ncbi:LOW QUALITY PROTEIN: hypothetical protein ACHAW6_003031 [Cyclotella cf. meneghiniana]
MAPDVLNANITTMPCREKIWTTLGKEFDDGCGWKAIIVRALYGLKSKCAAFRVHLARCLHEMGYLSCPLTLTCGSRNRQTGKASVIMPISSTTCLWSTITQDALWTRLTASFPSSPTQLAALRCILGLSSRRRPLKMVQWYGD